MTNTNENKLLLEVQLDWLSGTKGILSSNDAKDVTGTIHVGTHPELGGSGEPWSAQHLFLGSINSCFMSSFLELAQLQAIPVSHYTCSITGHAERSGGKYQFSAIKLYPKVYITDDAMREKVPSLLEAAFQNSAIIHAISTPISYKSDILVDPHPRNLEEDSLANCRE